MKFNAERRFNELCFRSNEGGYNVCYMISMVIVLFVFFLLPLSAMAERQRIVLDFADAKSRGGEQITIFLKKELVRQYPGINVSDLRLHKVILVTTSVKGRGLAQLRVGPNSSGVYQVGRHPGKGNGRYKHSFSPVILMNPFRQSWGPWQLLLDGDLKVRQVFLEVENRSRSGK
ncbi:MAG: hypothetical protein LC655_07580 [Bacteroidales bacterium]|nr:hypothetical protein [Bacteroidales bacterium]